MPRALLLLLGLAVLALIIAACGSKGIKTPTPEAVIGDIEAPPDVSGLAGATVFVSAGCGSCHLLAGVEGATGQIGPDLTVSLQGRDAAYIEEGILNPDAVIAEGFTAGAMPGTLGDQLSDQEIADLVELLSIASGGGESAG